MRTVLTENTHIVNILPPIDINGGANSDVFSLRDASHVSIITQIGVSASTPVTITVEECDDFTPANSTAIAFKYAQETTANGDTLGSLTNATTAGITTSENDNIFYVIEVDAEDLTEGYPCVRLVVADPGSSVIASAVAVISGLCYQGDQNRTQIV